MKKNMGTADQALRILAAVVLAILLFTNAISGTLSVVLAVLAIIFILTSLIGFCPLYLLFGIKTNNSNKKNQQHD